MRRVSYFAALALALAGCDSPPPPADSGPPQVDAGAVDCSGRPADAPGTRGEVNGIYDATNNRVLVYGGDTEAPVDCMPRYNLVEEMWALHLDCNSWERMTVSGGPGVRARHATTLDTTENRMLFFGGRLRVGFGEYQNFNDVWAFDLETDTWEQITTTGEGPSPRSSAVAAFDAERNRLIVMGGNVSTGGLTLTGAEDTFALDLATGEWSAITEPLTGPEPRLYHGGIVMDGALYIYAGTPNFDGPFYTDMWALDLSNDTWRLVSDGAGGPRQRFGAELFADPARGRVIMAMGHDFGPPSGLGNMNDVWALDVASGAWTELHPGDTLGNGNASRCDFPPDFATPEDGAPERRYSFVHAQSDTHAFIFGGKTDCGNINDVWSIELSNGDWTQLRPPTGGEACNRSGRTDCATLCF